MSSEYPQQPQNPQPQNPQPQNPQPQNPQQYPQQPYMPPPPPKKRRTGLIVLAIIGGILVLGLGGCLAIAALIGNEIDDPPVTTTAEPAPASSEPSKEPADEPAAKPYTLKITKCARGEYGSFDVVVQITNNTETEATYLFDIGLYDPKDNTVGSGGGSVSVKPGKSATAETFASLSDPDYKGKVTCEVKVTDF